MPVIFHASASGVPDCFLMLIAPDRNDRVSIGYRLTTEQAEG